MLTRSLLAFAATAVPVIQPVASISGTLMRPVVSPTLNAETVAGPSARPSAIAAPWEIAELEAHTASQASNTASTRVLSSSAPLWMESITASNTLQQYAPMELQDMEISSRTPGGWETRSDKL